MNLVNLNSTTNYNKQYSGIYIVSPTNLYSSQCSFIANTMSNDRIIMLRGNFNNYLYNYNVINNNSPVGDGVVTNWEGDYHIYNSIFLNNQKTLFSGVLGKIIINNCKIIHSSSYNIFLGTISKTNIFYVYTNTFIINHFDTYYCNKEFSSKFSAELNEYSKKAELIFITLILLTI